MRSRVIRPSDMVSAVKAYAWNAKPDREAAEAELYQAALQYKRYEPVEEIANGDIISITMKSTAKKFDRTLKLQVGGGLFDKTLEADLPGKRAGETYRLTHPAGEICYAVKEASRLVVPVLTDEMVRALGIEGVETPAALKTYHLRESLKKVLYDEVYDFIPGLLEQWEFAIEEEDLNWMDEGEMERCRGISASMGQVFDEMSEKELLGAVGCRNISEFRAMIRSYHGKALRAALAEAYLSGKDPDTIVPADVNKLYGDLMERVMLCSMDKIEEDCVC